MEIKLRDYQEKAISQLGLEGIQVLSICPGGGKTFTAIEYIKRNNFNRVLILAHGTNVLKSQWISELNSLGIDHSISLDSASKIVVTLPHSLKNAEILDFDLIIVDEAHEFFYAPMIQKAIERIKPKCMLLLTGTPSKFIKKGLKPIIISGCEIYNEKGGYLSNTYFGVVKSTYNLDKSEYTEDGEVLTEYVFTEEETVSSLKSLVKDMLKRLNSPDVMKNSPNLTNIISYVGLSKIQEVFTRLGKTMIACKTIPQAKSLFKHLKDCNINVVLSESESDVDSVNIKEFMSNDSVQVLLVVRRGILGFNYPQLVNVVDFTMSRNIDRIYQLYARVLRTHPDAPNKFFFRMCSALNPSIDSYYLQAAMCLNSNDFISKYNGKNLKQLPIIVPTKPPKDPKGEGGGSSGGGSNVNIDADVLDFVLGLELLTELTLRPESKHWHEFGYMKFGEVISKLNGVEFRDINPEEKKEKILEFIRINNRKPNNNSKYLEEKRLGSALRVYTSNYSKSFDREFKNKIDELIPLRIYNTSIIKDNILQFIKSKNKKPSVSSKDLNEKNLSYALYRYTKKNGDCFDIEFKNKINTLCKLNDTNTKIKILEFIKANNKSPRRFSKDLNEKRLGTALNNYVNQYSGSYDPEFKQQIDQLLKDK